MERDNRSLDARQPSSGIVTDGESGQMAPTTIVGRATGEFCYHGELRFFNRQLGDMEMTSALVAGSIALALAGVALVWRTGGA